VVDEAAGHIEVAWIETRAGEFEVERVEVFVRRVGELIFASVREVPGHDGDEADSGSERPYAFLRLDRESEKLLMWWPNVDAFKALVEAGKLPGKVTDSGDVVLEKLSAENLTVLSDDESATLWEWKDPGVLRRSSGG
jgi:hypothetical protein